MYDFCYGSEQRSCERRLTSETGATGSPSVAVTMLPNVNILLDIYRHMYYNNSINKQRLTFMSHPVNDELLETLYEEVKAEYPTVNDSLIYTEVMKRFEDMSM